MLTVLFLTIAALVVITVAHEIKQRPAGKHAALRRRVLNAHPTISTGTGRPVDIDLLPKKAGRR